MVDLLRVSPAEAVGVVRKSRPVDRHGAHVLAQGGCGGASRTRFGDDLIGAIDNMGGDERFRFTIRGLCHQTGLAHQAVIKAKHACTAARSSS